jgi:hypothetical protein
LAGHHALGPLADGNHSITASKVDTATGLDTISAGALNSTIDTVASALPTFFHRSVRLDRRPYEAGEEQPA